MPRTSKANTALLIFTRTAGNEARSKKFISHGSFEQNALIANELFVRTRSVAKHSRLSVFVCTDYHQVGQNFQERLANAIESVYAKGFEKVIAIGSDTPELSVNHIREAEQRLQSQQVVLGPSTDGGLYLIGMTKDVYEREAFVELSWLSEQVYEEFIIEAKSKGVSLSALEILQDVDDAADLLSVVCSLSVSDSFSQIIYHLLTKTPVGESPYIFSELYYGLDLGLRAPPQV